MHDVIASLTPQLHPVRHHDDAALNTSRPAVASPPSARYPWISYRDVCHICWYSNWRERLSNHISWLPWTSFCWCVAVRAEEDQHQRRIYHCSVTRIRSRQFHTESARPSLVRAPDRCAGQRKRKAHTMISGHAAEAGHASRRSGNSSRGRANFASRRRGMGCLGGDRLSNSHQIACFHTVLSSGRD